MNLYSRSDAMNRDIEWSKFLYSVWQINHVIKFWGCEDTYDSRKAAMQEIKEYGLSRTPPTV